MKEKEVIKRIKKEVKGITLMVLVVTIIVLLILAGVGISLIIGNNGIFRRAKGAVEEYEKASEKELVQRAGLAALMDDEEKTIKKINLESELIKEIGGGKTEVTDVGEEFEVVFNETNRYYVIDKNGNIKEEGEIIKDNYPGDITVGKDGESLDGSKDHPYEIWCIEDLVALSNMSDGEGYIYENGAIKTAKLIDFSGKYITLKRNLNFKSSLSYANSKRTDFGDINGNAEDGNELMNEMLTGTGFKPIGERIGFRGIFNGENNKINNIYIDRSSDENRIGFFSYLNGGKISNFNISGEIKGNGHAGGIVGEVIGGTIENCINYANITGYNMVGGICGTAWNGGSTTINKCKNYGNLEIIGKKWAYAGIGGIMGCAYNANDGKSEIEECENYGSINLKEVNVPTGGIIGCSNVSATANLIINSCHNKGNLGKEIISGGIIGYVRNGNTTITNSSNYGKCYCGIVSKYNAEGWDAIMNLNIKNCYNLGNATYSGILGIQGKFCQEITLDIENCYTGGISNKAIIGDIEKNEDIQTVTNVKNTYYDKTKSESIGAITEGITEVNIQNNSEFVNTLNANIEGESSLKKWKLGEDGYPTFVD